MREFAGKVAVITGAASGIGLAIAERCLSEGMKVVLADVEAESLARVTAELSGRGSGDRGGAGEGEGADASARVIGVRTDVSKRADVEELARRAVEAFGQVDLLFNNAGVAGGGAPWEASWNDWEWVIGVNLWGVIHGVKVFTPLMMAQGTEGHIVNTASGAGLVVGGFSAPYSVTKHGVVALSENLYLNLEARGAKVKVSVLCPGLVRTGIGETERNRPVELKNDPVAMTPQMEAGRAAFFAALEAAMAPEQVAEMVFDGIEKEQFYILTHPEWMEVVRMRTDRLVRLENPLNPAGVLARLVKAQRDGAVGG
jgi:NAD(P)-dependent dehydrogenase (short-subunit alcohol dehydrogenase family)